MPPPKLSLKESQITQLEVELPNAAAAEVEATPDNYESALGKAIAYWRIGRSIPMTLAVELMGEGYDVGALEDQHLKGCPCRSSLNQVNIKEL